jgi:hypothetical protein
MRGDRTAALAEVECPSVVTRGIFRQCDALRRSKCLGDATGEFIATGVRHPAGALAYPRTLRGGEVGHPLIELYQLIWHLIVPVVAATGLFPASVFLWGYMPCSTFVLAQRARNAYVVTIPLVTGDFCFLFGKLELNSNSVSHFVHVVR